jgi:RHS repeat-associated protein
VNPGYSSTTNQYTLSGTSYDSNGNVTNDTWNTYGSNEFSKMASVNQSGTDCATSGECIVYDALGRAVEIDDGSTHTEVWYTQLGKTVLMNGNVMKWSYWPAPGGGTVAYNGASYYMHKDWLGSARILSVISSSPTVLTDKAYAPYGEVYDVFHSTLQWETMFGGGSTQDVIAGMYNTPNRELQGSQQGRFLSPDPAGAGWNQYGYPTNPNSMVDPSGLDGEPGCTPGSNCGAGGVGTCSASYSCSSPCSEASPCGPGSTGWGTQGTGCNGQCDGSDGGTVGADSGSSSSSPSSPQLCLCTDDITSGEIGSSTTSPPDFGPQLTSSGTPSGIQIGGFDFQYQGPNCCYIDSQGNPALLFPASSADATVFANAWTLQVVNENQQPMSGNFSVTETVNTAGLSNLDAPIVNSQYTWTTNFDGQFVDNLELAPTNLNAAEFSMTRQTFAINGTPASTVMNQFTLYQPGMGLVIGNPWYANGP